VPLGVVAHVVFWLLLLFRITQIGVGRAVSFVVLWGIGYAVSGWFMIGSMLFTSYVAVLDIVLVLLVFKGDVQLR
jgi:hypothetical protein